MIIVITVILIILLSFHRDWGEQEPNIIHNRPPTWNFIVVFTPTPEQNSDSTPEPVQIPAPELTPTPEFDESGFLVISGFGRQPRVSSFTHFSGIVIQKDANSITIVDFFATAQLLILIGKNTSVIIHDSEALTGIRQGARNDIALGAWVEVEGYYIEKDDTLDTNAVRWDGKPGQIEIMDTKPINPRK